MVKRNVAITASREYFILYRDRIINCETSSFTRVTKKDVGNVYTYYRMFVAVYHVNHKTSKTIQKLRNIRETCNKRVFTQKLYWYFLQRSCHCVYRVVTVILRETNRNAEIPLISLFFCKRSINVKREEINKQKKEI